MVRVVGMEITAQLTRPPNSLVPNDGDEDSAPEPQPQPAVKWEGERGGMERGEREV